MLIIDSIFVYSQEQKMVFRNLGPIINTENDEFLPVVYKDTLYFRRTTTKSKGKKIEIYRTEIKNWTCENDVSVFPVFPITNYQNSSKKINGIANFDPSSPTFFNYTDSIVRWELPKQAGSDINTEFNDFHPAMSITGDTLIFVSDRPEGNVGGTDMYITIRKADGSWKAPKNLGKKFNTKLNEVSPFIAPNGDLYFSSQGYRKGVAEIYLSGQSKKNSKNLSDVQMMETKINFDIMRCRKTESGWGNPEKLPFPINTEWDEIGPTVYKDSIIVASNRPSNILWGTAFSPGYDLYGYCKDTCLACEKGCNDVVISGIVTVQNIHSIAGKGPAKFEIRNNNGQVINKGIIGSNNTFYARCKQSEMFFIRIEHPCLPSPGYIESTINHKCNKEMSDTIQTETFDLHNLCGSDKPPDIPCRSIILDGHVISKCNINPSGTLKIVDTNDKEIATVNISNDGKFYKDSFTENAVKSAARYTLFLIPTVK